MQRRARYHSDLVPITSLFWALRGACNMLLCPIWGFRHDHQIRLTADIRKGLIFSRTAEGRVRVNGGRKNRVRTPVYRSTPHDHDSPPWARGS